MALEKWLSSGRCISVDFKGLDNVGEYHPLPGDSFSVKTYKTYPDAAFVKMDPVSGWSGTARDLINSLAFYEIKDEENGNNYLKATNIQSANLDGWILYEWRLHHGKSEINENGTSRNVNTFIDTLMWAEIGDRVLSLSEVNHSKMLAAGVTNFKTTEWIWIKDL